MYQLPDTTAIVPVEEPVAPEEIAVTPPEEPKLSVFGYIQSDDRLKFNGGKLNFQEYRLDAKLEYKPFEKSKMYAEVWLRTYRFPELYSVNDLSDKKRLLNFDADIREAYFDIYGLFTKNLDIRVGRQRIAWGTLINSTLPTTSILTIWKISGILGATWFQCHKTYVLP